MKTSLSIILVVTIIFNMVGFFFVFKVQQAHIRKDIKHQIKAGIPKDELHFFSLSKEEYNQLEWVRPDIEFSQGGQMFDVVRSNATPDSIELFCVNDKEETILFAQLDLMVKKKLDQESNAPNSPVGTMVKFLKLVQVSDSKSFTVDPYAVQMVSCFSELKSFYQSPDSEVLTPPPNKL